MAPTRVLILGAGGTAGNNVIESLRDSPEPLYLVGADCNHFHLEWPEVDRVYLIPPSTAPDYIDRINDIVERERIDLVHAQPDSEVRVVSDQRAQLRARLFLPDQEIIHLLQDKLRSAAIWQRAGLHDFPTLVVTDARSMRRAVAKLGLPLWLRATVGAGARGSTLVENIETAIHWLGYWRARGADWTFIAQPYLPGREYAFQSLWHAGELITSQGRERLEYIFPHIAPSGKTGTSAVTVTVHDDALNEAATRAILAVDPRPHGVYSVDLVADRGGRIVPTEINAGRFFTTTYFYSLAGLNMPYYYVRLAMGEPIPALPKYNALPAGLYWIRHMDCPAVLVRDDEMRYRQHEANALSRLRWDHRRSVRAAVSTV
jgi:carbamoylphosphate synthase large subunit